MSEAVELRPAVQKLFLLCAVVLTLVMKEGDGELVYYILDPGTIPYRKYVWLLLLK